jgi:hypothetical protein
MVENTSPVAPLSPAAPGHREPLELAARLASIVMVGWLCALAAFAWIAYRDGYTTLLLPIWNSLFALCMVPIVHGIFARRLWAQRWVVGISVFTGAGSAFQAMRTDSTLLWVGAFLLAAVAIVVKRAKPLFNDSDGNRGRIQQLIATVVTIGSVVVSLQTMKGGGTARGREMFAQEVQSTYDKLAVGTVRVYIDGEVNLVIEGKTDTNEQIDEAATAMDSELVKVGSRAKAWVVGFKRIILTNGSYQRVLTRDAPPGR